MSGITKLPCEIITSVLRHVGSLQSLSSALLTCHHFHSSFKENPHVAVEIVEQQIGSLIPYAIATVEASCLEPQTVSAVQVLLDKLQRRLQAEPQTKPSMLAKDVAAMPLELLSKMSRTHDIIHAFVTAYANSAWMHLSVDLGEDLSLSPAEYFRFCRAFYRMELYFRLFSSDSDMDESGSAGAKFLRTMPPWENEQIGCAQDYLELQFSKGAVVLALTTVLFSTQITYDAVLRFATAVELGPWGRSCAAVLLNATATTCLGRCGKS